MKNSKKLQIITSSCCVAAFLNVDCSGQAIDNIPFAINSSPQNEIDNYTYSDGSIATTWRVVTVPGVKYTIQTSENLQDWTDIDEVYGLGHELIYPMVYRQAPLNPPESTTNAIPKRPISMILRKCNQGGIVISWRSLENETFKVIHLSSLEMATAWESQMIYAKAFGKFYFLISHPPIPQDAPTLNSSVIEGTVDQEVLDQFTSSFEAMNTEVESNLAISSTIPTAPSPLNGSRKFWRASADWFIDSDGDGSPDWIELEILRQQAESNATPNEILTTADPANADANKDGIKDGKQINFDGDTINDDDDACAYDGLINWKKCLPTRYALFELPLVYYENSTAVSQPIGINSNGLVLYKQGVFFGDQLHVLAKPASIFNVNLLSLNDNDAVIGTASLDKNSDQIADDFGMVSWNSTSDTAKQITSNNFYASPTYSMAYGLLNFGSDFASDGTFIAEKLEKVTDNDGNIDIVNHGNELWGLSSQGIVSAMGPAPLDVYCADSQTRWHFNEDGEIIFNSLNGSTGLGVSGHHKYQLVGDNEQPVLLGGIGEAKFFHNNQWSTSSVLPKVAAISKEGIVATFSNKINDQTQPLAFWVNGTPLTTDRMIPDASTSLGNAFLYGMSNNAYLLLGSNDVNGYITSTKLGVPCAFEDDEKYSGLDDFSIGSTKKDTAANDKIWIMVPSGEGNVNTIKSHCRASSSSLLQFSSEKLSAPMVLNNTSQNLSFNTTQIDSEDANLDIKLGNKQCLNSPVGIKIMKRRAVKVAIHPIVWQSLADSSITDSPDYLPSQLEIESYLNKVYEKQINAKMDVTIKAPRMMNFSNLTGAQLAPPDQTKTAPALGDKRLDYIVGNPLGEQNQFSSIKDESADINVYVLGGYGISALLYHSKLERWVAIPAAGIADVQTNQCWIDGDLLLSATTPQASKIREMNTIAHEIGHIMLGKGHPDEGGGPAPLAGTNHIQRLMVSGGNRGGLDLEYRLVKGEWDAAEVWLKNRQLGDN